MMKNKKTGKPNTKKRLIILACVTLVVAVTATVAAKNVAVGFQREIGQRCLSFVADKAGMKAVDRIVIETPTKSTEITDTAILEPYLASTLAPVSYSAKWLHGENFAYLYSGEKLIRKMQIGSNVYTIILPLSTRIHPSTISSAAYGNTILTGWY